MAEAAMSDPAPGGKRLRAALSAAEGRPLATEAELAQARGGLDLGGDDRGAQA